MEKETVSKFNLEAAFKALEELEAPKTSGKLLSTRVNLQERFSAKHGLEALVEDYYDVNSTDELEAAKDEREAEVAKAKLARIEKIVDLDAETEEDILPSYVGKVIIQCPQCMTLFYKNEEDIEKSEETPEVVNINEVCQHCGNTSGYSLIGKVGGINEDEAENFDLDEINVDEDELNLDFPEEGTEEVDPEGTGEANLEDENLDLDLDLEDVPEEEEEEFEEVEESLHNSEMLKDAEEKSELKADEESEHLTLNEGAEETLTEDLDDQMDTYNDYVAYLQAMISQEEAALDKAENELVKGAIQRRLDAFKADLEAALPDVVKNEVTEENITSELEDDAAAEPMANEETSEEVEESLHNSEALKDAEEVSELATENGSENLTLHESLEEDVSDEEYDELLSDLWSGKQPTEEETKAILDKLPDAETEVEESFNLDEVEDFDEESFNEHFSKYMTETYSNVSAFEATSCAVEGKNLVVEGVIKFESGKSKTTKFVFESSANCLIGSNADLCENKAFTVQPKITEKKLVTESIKYSYKIGENLVEGSTR